MFRVYSSTNYRRCLASGKEFCLDCVSCPRGGCHVCMGPGYTPILRLILAHVWHSQEAPRPCSHLKLIVNFCHRNPRRKRIYFAEHVFLMMFLGRATLGLSTLSTISVLKDVAQQLLLKNHRHFFC